MRTVDKDGNRIVYDYHFVDEQQRANRFTSQATPALSVVSWGGNDNTGLADPFAVRVELSSSVIHSGANLLQGNVVTKGLIGAIAVCGPSQSFPTPTGTSTIGESHSSCPGSSLYRRYTLAFQQSPDTKRHLLSEVMMSEPEVTTPERWSFTYSANQDGRVQFDPPQRFISGDTQNALLGTMLSTPTISSTRREALVADTTSVGARFIDVSGDGRSDLIFHAPGVVSASAPIGITANPISYQTGGQMVEAFGGPVPRSAAPIEGGGWAPAVSSGWMLRVPGHDGATLRSTGLRSTDNRGLFRYHDLADVDGDGQVDGVFFAEAVTDHFNPIGRTGGACFSEAFWARCGAIDPVAPDVCDVSSLCERMQDIDLSMCADGSCWITEPDLVRLFSDWNNWDTESPFSKEGEYILHKYGAWIDPTLKVVAVPADELRARLGFAPPPPKAPEFTVSANTTMESCAGLIESCTASC